MGHGQASIGNVALDLAAFAGHRAAGRRRTKMTGASFLGRTTPVRRVRPISPPSELPSTPVKALIVDDDPKFRRYVSRGLTESNIECLAASSPDEARSVLAENPSVDLILLDVMMPGASGWQFLEGLRGSGDETPVIFVTARHAVDERIKGLTLGADDYIIKPFDFKELLARIEAVMRRHPGGQTIQVEDLTIDRSAKNVTRGERAVDLSPREFDLLVALAEADGEVISRSELLSRVWGIDFDPGTNLVDVQVGRLRRKLDGTGPGLVQTVVGKGYRLGLHRQEPR